MPLTPRRTPSSKVSQGWRHNLCHKAKQYRTNLNFYTQYKRKGWQQQSDPQLKMSENALQPILMKLVRLAAKAAPCSTSFRWHLVCVQVGVQVCVQEQRWTRRCTNASQDRFTFMFTWDGSAELSRGEAPVGSTMASSSMTWIFGISKLNVLV